MAENCSTCHGTGRCPHCQGSGRLGYPGIGNLDAFPAICGFCQGSGCCSACNGTGQR